MLQRKPGKPGAGLGKTTGWIHRSQLKMKQVEMLSGVKRGDRVVTGGGIIGLVTKVISDNELQVELADGVRVRIVKQTITDILTRGESVRGAKDGEEDDKPMLPPPAPITPLKVRFSEPLVNTTRPLASADTRPCVFSVSEKR